MKFKEGDTVVFIGKVLGFSWEYPCVITDLNLITNTACLLSLKGEHALHITDGVNEKFDAYFIGVQDLTKLERIIYGIPVETKE